MKATLEAPTRAMEADPTVFVLGEGIGKRGGNFATTTGLYDRFGPVRLCDTPIAERGFVGMSCGAAMTGTRPVVDFMFADFVLDGVGEILNQIAKMQYMSSGRLTMPVLLRGCIGIGHSAATHHSGNYYPLYAHFPGLRVVVPSTAADAKVASWPAPWSDDLRPCSWNIGRCWGLKGPFEGDFEIEFGKAAVVRGDDGHGRSAGVHGPSVPQGHAILDREGDLDRPDRPEDRMLLDLRRSSRPSARPAAC